jgi:hypothetical protein
MLSFAKYTRMHTTLAGTQRLQLAEAHLGQHSLAVRLLRE